MRAIVRTEAEAMRDVRALRAQLERMQGRRLDAPALPTHPAFSGLLAGGGLRPGAAYSLAPSAALLLALLARPSQDGAWCAVLGMPDLGVEAAERYGLDLDRLVLVPEPGPRWLAVTAAIAEVMPVVAVRPPARVADGDVSRLAARLRDRGSVLLVQGAWPQVEATIEVADPRWSGVGAGHGYLAGRELTVSVRNRTSPSPRRARMLLPAADGTVSLLGAVAAAGKPRPEAVPDFVETRAAG